MSKAQKWKELKREVMYSKWGQTVERRDYQLPNGEIVDYYIYVEVPGACVLALTKENEVITIPQFRPGPDTILREIPGGRVDKYENPRTSAMRELLEETGYSGDIEDWVGTWQADSRAQINRTIVIARNCIKVAQPQLRGTEFGEVELVDIPEFVAQVRTGQLTDTAGAMLALDHLDLLRH